MSRYDYIKPLEYFVMKRLSKDYRKDDVAAGPFLSFDKAEDFRSKYFGHDNNDFYLREGSED
jgi:hypothetical protein